MIRYAHGEPHRLMEGGNKRLHTISFWMLALEFPGEEVKSSTIFAIGYVFQALEAFLSDSIREIDLLASIMF